MPQFEIKIVSSNFLFNLPQDMVKPPENKDKLLSLQKEQF